MNCIYVLHMYVIDEVNDDVVETAVNKSLLFTAAGPGFLGRIMQHSYQA